MLFASTQISLSADADATPPSTRARWTIQDVLTAPEVTALILDRSGRNAAYVVQSVDLDQDRPLASMILVDLKTGAKRVLLNAETISRLRRVPNADDWTFLADLGKGQQLYRVGILQGIKAEVVQIPTVVTGSADGSVTGADGDPAQTIGVLSYDWSPDGRWLWYSSISPETDLRVQFDDDVSNKVGERRPAVSAHIAYWLRSSDGQTKHIASRPLTDRIARFYGGNASWAGENLSFVAEDGPRENATYAQYEVDLRSGASSRLATPPASPFVAPILGPHGGRLATTGFDRDRALEEQLAGRSSVKYGKVDFILGDSRTPGNWRSADGKLSIVGTRYVQHPRYGLTLVTPMSARALDVDGSLTKCDFVPNLGRGVCVREGLAVAPEIVLVKPLRDRIKFVASVSERHSAIMPLRITSTSWTNRYNYQASGFIIWPRDYRAGQRYPAIVVTHGSDADERFARNGFQWNYPIQVFAERGFVVLLVNDPAPNQSEKLAAAYAQWGGGQGGMTPAVVQQLVWLSGVATFETAVGDLIESGVIDPNRVGIAGYSRGSQMVNVTMTQSAMFRAASSGDGGYLEPSAYPRMIPSYSAIYGGTPYGSSLENYLQFAPSLRADKARGAVLQQMATPLGGAIEFYRALRAAGVPTQIDLFPGRDQVTDESHIFSLPSNRSLAMRENVAWFEFWLKGQIPDDQPFPARFAAWQTMAANAQADGRIPTLPQ